MTQIVTRSGKGSALTYEEMDSNLTNLKTDVESTQANVTAANAAITTANTGMKTYVDGQVSTLTANAATQHTTIATTTTDISGLRANITAANAVIATKTTTTYVDTAISTAINNLISAAPGTLDTLGEIAANLATNADTVGAILNSITSTNANVTAANARIQTLDANLGTATTNISSLFANAGTQSTDITTLGANAAAQGSDILALRANVTAANARIQTLDANLGTVTTNISALQSNAATQATQIVTLDGNLGTATTNITTLQSNAGTQATTINLTNANLGAFQAYANVTFGTTSYGNTQAQALLAAFGSNSISTTGNVTAGRVTATTLVTTPEIESATDLDINVTGAVNANGNLRIGDNNSPTQISTHGTGDLILRTHSGAANQGNIRLYNGTNGNTDVTLNGTGTLNLTTQQVKTTGYFVSAGGYFWSNGTAYSTGGAGTFGNTEVGAFLPGYTGTLAQSSTIQDLVANAATQATLIAAKANTASLSAVATSGLYTDLTGSPVIPSGLVTLSGDVTATGNTGSNITVTLASTGVVAGTFGSDTQAPQITVDAKGRITAISNVIIAGGGGYGNTQVTAYLPTYTGELNGNLTSGNVINSTGLARLQGSTETFVAAGSNVYVTAGTYLDMTAPTALVINSTPRIDVNDGNLNVYRNTSTLLNGSIYADNNIQANVKVIAPAFTFANGVNILSTVASSYGNTEVAAYLNGSTTTVRNGGVNNLSLIGGENTPGTGALLTLAPATVSIGGFPGPVAFLNTTNLAVSSGHISTSYGPRIEDVIYDTVKGRVFANAFPLSTGQVTIPNNSTSRFFAHTPVYTSGVLQQPPLANATVGGTGIVNNSSQTIALVASANVGLQSGYAFGSQNRDTIGSVFALTVTPVTANSMAAQDRVRGAFGSTDVVMTGQSWGLMTTAGQNQNTVSAINGAANFNGYGNLASIVGGTYGSLITPAAAQTANIQYATAVLGFLNLLTTAGTTGKANVVYSRGLTPFISGFSSNLTVQNAVGLHTYSGWAGSGAVGTASNPVVGRWALLNEDANTAIQSNGNILFSNAGPVGSTVTINSRFANVASQTTFTGAVSFSTAPLGVTGRANTAFAAGFGSTAVIGGMTFQACLSSSNIAQIGSSTGSITYSATTTEIISGTQTVRSIVNGSASALQNITTVSAGLDNLGDTLVALVTDHTNSVVYRITYVKTSVGTGSGSPFGGVTIERLI